MVLYEIYSKKIEGDEYLCPWTVGAEMTRSRRCRSDLNIRTLPLIILLIVTLRSTPSNLNTYRRMIYKESALQLKTPTYTELQILDR